MTDEGEDVCTSSGSDYVVEKHRGAGSSDERVSFEGESKFLEDVGGGTVNEWEPTSRSNGKAISIRGRCGLDCVVNMN